MYIFTDFFEPFFPYPWQKRSVKIFLYDCSFILLVFWFILALCILKLRCLLSEDQLKISHPYASRGAKPLLLSLWKSVVLTMLHRECSVSILTGAKKCFYTLWNTKGWAFNNGNKWVPFWDWVGKRLPLSLACHLPALPPATRGWTEDRLGSSPDLGMSLSLLRHQES